MGTGVGSRGLELRDLQGQLGKLGYGSVLYYMNTHTVPPQYRYEYDELPLTHSHLHPSATPSALSRFSVLYQGWEPGVSPRPPLPSPRLPACPNRVPSAGHTAARHTRQDRQDTHSLTWVTEECADGVSLSSLRPRVDSTLPSDPAAALR